MGRPGPDRSPRPDHALRRGPDLAGVEQRPLDGVAAALGVDGVLAGGGDRVLCRRRRAWRGSWSGWLRAFGPGTAADIKWWLGSTVAAVRRALADLEAVEVELDGQTGYLLPDDLEVVEPVAPWAALLPPLDPTTMGWFERDWYLGPYKSLIFDTNGNAGPTMWWDGRIVGGWRQGEDGEVILQPLEDVGTEALAALETEAARLTDWLAGTRFLPRFPSPLFKTT